MIQQIERFSAEEMGQRLGNSNESRLVAFYIAFFHRDQGETNRKKRRKRKNTAETRLEQQQKK